MKTEQQDLCLKDDVDHDSLLTPKIHKSSLKKKTTIILVVIIIVIVIIALALGIFFYLRSNDNSPTKVEVKTCKDLQDGLSRNYSEVVFTDNISCENFNFQQITIFEGTLDGNGFVLSNLNFTNTPMFVINRGIIHNIKFQNISLILNDTINAQSLGIIANNQGIIANLTISTNIILEKTASGFSGIGGLIGNNSGNLSSINANISFNNPNNISIEYFGGLIGFQGRNSNLVIIQNINMSFQTSNNTKCGGVIGFGNASPITIRNVSIDLLIDSDLNDIGGIIGYLNDSDTIDLDNLTVTGIVRGGNNVGGVFGYCDCPIVSISNSKSSLSLEGNDYVGGFGGIFLTENATFKANTLNFEGTINGGSDIGGIFGKFSSESTIEQCFSIGNIVSASDNSEVGGIIGNCEYATIKNCFSSMNITGSHFLGGLFGLCSDSKIHSSQYTGRIIGQSEGDSISIGGLAGEILNSFVLNFTSSGELTSSMYLGGLSGISSNTNFSNCSSSMKITGKSTVGGLVGHLISSKFEYSFYNGNITIQQGNNNAISNYGGIAGKSEDSKIVNSSTIGIIFNSLENVGGLLGSSEKYINITHSYSEMKLSGQNYVGGLIGNVYSGTQSVLTIQESFFNGSISLPTSGSSCFVGGLIGYQNENSLIRICQSYSTDSIAGTEFVGGLIGLVSFNVSLSNSYCVSSVRGEEHLGGLIGAINFDEANITNCYSAGGVTSTTGSATAGGMVGFNDTQYTPTVVSSYWDTEASSQQSSNGGTGETTQDMKNKATYQDWDFENIWMFQEGFDYPILKCFQ